MDWSRTASTAWWEGNSAPRHGLSYVAQKHPERPDRDQYELVRAQKSGSRPSEIESSRGLAMLSMEQSGQIRLR